MSTRNICLSMTEEALEHLKELEARTGKSKSRIVRDAIKDAVNSSERDTRNAKRK